MECGLLGEHDTTKMIEEFDWEHMFDDVQLPEDAFDFVDANSISPEIVSGESWICEIEQMLMKDDDDHDQDSGVVVDGFNLSEILLDSPEKSSPEILEKNSPCSSPNSNPNSDSEGNVNVNGGGVVNLSDDNVNSSSPDFDNKSDDHATDDVNDSKDDEDDDNDDPLSKKRKRQLRNRDAAMRSRERKKMYVKDLEVKSRYLEAECRRLGRLLQCCYAENQMLRISLQSGSTFAKANQESAVLLLESLLLGSLVWFMALMCLLPLPSFLALSKSQGPVPLGSTNRKNPGSAAQRRKGTNPSEQWLALLFTRSKRCRASRTKMKPNFTCQMAIF